MRGLQILIDYAALCISGLFILYCFGMLIAGLWDGFGTVLNRNPNWFLLGISGLSLLWVSFSWRRLKKP